MSINKAYLKQENLILRRLLWLGHGSCEFGALFRENGEMQCLQCRIDFKRMDAGTISKRLLEIALKRWSTAADSPRHDPANP